MNLSLIIIILIPIIHLSLSSVEDEIIALPGLAEKLSFRQYSGYLSGGEGLHLHYWFVESQGNPKKDPVILWLNGGPGCSSLDGLLTENGPFRIGSNGKTVTLDPNSWNTLANVLYLESPIDVGFSYSARNGTFRNTDNTTAEINYHAIQDFFRKFPEFASNDFYITGESYAGIYIPTLAVQIYRGNATINLKGLAIGNGFFDRNLMRSSVIDLALGHGFIDAKDYGELVRDCCGNGPSCDYYANEQCGQKAENFNIYDVNDEYNVLDDCHDNYFVRVRRVLEIKHPNIKDMSSRRLFSWPPSPACKFSNYTYYMNTPEVRKALHIPDHVKHWSLCGNAHYKEQYDTMRAQFKELIEVHKVPTFIVYNGDLDLVCDFLGDQRFVDSLGYKLTHKLKAWVNKKRIGGFVKRYEGITFTTVRGAGHMVPSDQPEAALAIVKELIGIQKLTYIS